MLPANGPGLRCAPSRLRLLATRHDNADFAAAMNEIRPPRRRRAKPRPELAPAGTPPHVAVAPGVLDQEHVVIRSADDTDEDYEARRKVFAAALAFARKG
jgi:hypothetical protein